MTAVREHISPVPEVLTDPSAAALCRDLPAEQQELFLSDATAKQRAAARLCRQCQLIDPCREYALAQPPRQLFGVWGGTTHASRRRMAGEDR